MKSVFLFTYLDFINQRVKKDSINPHSSLHKSNNSIYNSDYHKLEGRYLNKFIELKKKDTNAYNIRYPSIYKNSIYD